MKVFPAINSEKNVKKKKGITLKINYWPRHEFGPSAMSNRLEIG